MRKAPCAAAAALFLAACHRSTPRLSLSVDLERPPTLRCGSPDPTAPVLDACMEDTAVIVATNADEIRVYGGEDGQRLVWRCSGWPPCVRLGRDLAARFDMGVAGRGYARALAVHGAGDAGRWDTDVLTIRDHDGEVANRSMRVR